MFGQLKSGRYYFDGLQLFGQYSARDAKPWLAKNAKELDAMSWTVLIVVEEKERIYGKRVSGNASNKTKGIK